MTLGEIFSGNFSYEVPHYQRPYEWPDRLQWKLCSDLHQAWREGDSYRFLGTIIVNHDPINGRHEVVDGQQRLVTLLVFLRSIVYWVKEHEKHNEDAQYLMQFIHTGHLFQLRDALRTEAQSCGATQAPELRGRRC